MLSPPLASVAIEFVHTGDPGEELETPAVRREVARFRAMLERVLIEEAMGRGANETDLEQLNRILHRAGEARGIVPTVRGYGWGWIRDPGPVVRRLFPPAWSAAQLLSGDDRQRLKCCQGCGRLFLDASKNRSRRWCEMEVCGNRAKVAAHRRRTRRAAASAADH